MNFQRFTIHFYTHIKSKDTANGVFQEWISQSQLSYHPLRTEKGFSKIFGHKTWVLLINFKLSMKRAIYFFFNVLYQKSSKLSNFWVNLTVCWIFGYLVCWICWIIKIIDFKRRNLINVFFLRNFEIRRNSTYRWKWTAVLVLGVL